MNEYIEIKNARTHNLKGINLKIPINKLTVISGPSGSGKTSLAVHTLYAESKRRFINSMSDSSKFLWQIPSSIEVDSIKPILPTWCLMQRNPIVGSRQNVADLLGLSEKLEKIFFALSKIYCPTHLIPLSSDNLSKWLTEICLKYQNQKAYFFKYNLKNNLSDNLKLQSLYFLDLEKNERCLERVSDYEEFAKTKLLNPKDLIIKINEALSTKNQVKIKVLIGNEVLSFLFDSSYTCMKCDYKSSLRVQSWHDLSSYRASSACQHCQGYGMKLVYDRCKLVKNPSLSLNDRCVNFLTYKPFEHFYQSMLKLFKKNGFDLNVPFDSLPESKWNLLYKEQGDYPGFNSLFAYLESKKYKKNVRIYLRSMQSEILCEDCEGSRVDSKLKALSILNSEKKAIQFPTVLKMSINELYENFKSLEIFNHESVEKQLKSILEILDAAKSFKLGEINISRKAKTLAAGEYQKILLLKYISHQGSGSLFILDEPSLGLSHKEQIFLLASLQKLKQQKNTLLLIEHNPYFQKNADNVVCFGPGAGYLGGEIVSEGAIPVHPKLDSFTKIEVKEKILLSIASAKILHIEKRDIVVYKNMFHLVKGDSGSGRSLIYTQVIYHELMKHLENLSSPQISYNVKKVFIDESFKNIEVFNNDANTFTSRSTFGTYTELAKILRSYYMKLPVSRVLSLEEGHFSANSALGQCLTCAGQGISLIKMNMIENMELSCEDCQGQKLKPIYANISDGEHTFYEACQLPVSELKKKLTLTPKFKRLFQYLELLKLDYLALDRKVSSLSGGEVQRLRLLNVLMKVKNESLLVFKNLSYGLSSKELYTLCEFLHQLTKQNITIVMIDNHQIIEQFAHKIIDFSVT